MFSNKRSNWFFPFSITFLLLVSFTIFGFNETFKDLYPINKYSKVLEDPVADFSFSPNNVCANEPIKFTNLSTGTGLTYEWNFKDGNTSTQKDPSHVFSSATGNGVKNFSVTLTVKDEAGVSKSVSKTVAVKEIPSLKVTSDQEETTFENLQYYIVCENQPSEFTFYNAEGSSENNTDYEIDWGDGSAVFKGSSWSELKHTFDVGIYNITYTVTPENGCKVSRKFGVFVGSNPAVGLGNPGNTNVCVGDELTFPITGTENNPEGTIYTVTFSDGSTPQVFNHPPPPTVSHVFTKGSCGEEADGFENSFSVKIVALNPCSASQASVVPIYVSEPPIPEIKVSSETVCVEGTVTITNETDFKTEVSTNGSCNDTKRFVWEISPATGWTLPSGSELGNRPNPTSPNSWSSGSERLQPKFTTPGTYTIKLITGNRCGIREETKTIQVIPIPEPSFTLSEEEICGPASVKATNTSNILGHDGDGTYTWAISYSKGTCGTTSSWEFISGSDKSSESPSFLFNNPGIYTVSLTIKASCGTFKEEKKITVTAPPTVTINSIPLTCGPTTFTPSANVVVCGNDTPTYKWTFEGGTPSTSTSLDPGPIEFNSIGAKKITLEVTSSCGITTVEKSFSVANTPKIDLGNDQEICSGEEITINSSVAEGSGNYNYKWTSVPAGSIPNSTSDKIIVKPTQPTTYKLTVTDQETQCVNEEEIFVNVIPAPTIQFSIPDQEICSGETTLPVLLSSTPNGENITWTVEPNGISGFESSGTNEIPAQTLVNTTGKQIKVVYTALISNSSQGNCSVVPFIYTVTVNPEPVYSNEEFSICSDEEFDFEPSGNVSGSSFTWTVNAPPGITGASNSSQPVTSLNQVLQNETNNPIEVIYNITPSIGTCFGGDFTLKVTVQPAPSINFSEVDQSLCTGSESKEVIISSDVAGATFTWSADPKGVQGVITSGTSSKIPVQSLINISDAPITLEYKINVSTSSGGTCSGTPKIYKITVNPSIQIMEEVSDFNGFQISCFGADDGFIKLNASGGGGVFTYSWSGPNGFISAESDISNLSPGSYHVKIEDEFGCSLSKSFEIKEPKALKASIVSTTMVLCAGDESGAIELSVTGGVDTKDYSFEWTRNGAIFNKSTQNISSIPAGTYDVIVSDSNGCFTTISGIEITQPAAAIVINYTKTNISCYGANDGSLDLEVSGGLPPYTINWTFGSDQSGFQNLAPGDYTLTVSDQSGCIRSQTITIEDAPLFKSEPEVSNISCFGANDGSIKLNLQGGVGATTIRWDHGEQLENLFNLGSGFYGVTIKDETECEIRSEFNIVEPALLIIEPKITDALDCDDPHSGEIKLGISGGTPPYNINWSNGETSEILSGITSGQYAVNIVDASGCTINQAFEVKRPPALTITAFQSTSVICEPREIENEINITVSGGVAPYTIEWSGGNISPDRKSMTTSLPGLYEVKVTDGKGCITSQSFDLENTETIAETEIESAAFDQYNSYLVNFEIQFWNKSFGQILTYHWDFGDGTESFDENPKHTYEAEGDYEIVLTVTDIFGCPVEVRKEISVFDYYLVVPNVFTPNGDGINDYFFPKFIGIESLEFWVLNKWGETIYYSKDMESQGWNGKIQDETPIPGNYVYKLKFKTLDGRTQTMTDLFLLLK